MAIQQTAADGAPTRRAAVLVAGEASGGRVALVETVEVRGSEPPRHRHHWEDELLYVLDGTLHVCIGSESVTAPAGTAVLLPRGIDHAFAVVTESARVLTVLAPAGFEGFHRELGEPSAGEVLERLVITAARGDCEITGPPPGQGRDGTDG